MLFACLQSASTLLGIEICCDLNPRGYFETDKNSLVDASEQGAQVGSGLLGQWFTIELGSFAFGFLFSYKVR